MGNSKYNLKNEREKKKYSFVKENLSYEIEWSISIYFQNVVKNLQTIEKIKMELNNSKEFDVKFAFIIIDEENTKYIDKNK